MALASDPGPFLVVIVSQTGSTAPVREPSRLGLSPVVLAPLVALATWPTWSWYVARMTDGSDEPLGVLAMVTAGAFVPRRGWLDPLGVGALATACVALTVYALGFHHLPALVRAAAAVIALASVLPRPGALPRLPRLAMLLLSLPLIASLQFYLGFPLRAVTSWLAAHLLTLAGVAVEAHGTVLRWAGEEILVDVPCSGIRMLWTACYVSTAFALMFRLADRPFMRLIHLTAGAVFVANLARTLLLFFIESGLWPGLRWAHETVGVILFAGVVALCARQVGRLRALAPVRDKPPPLTKPAPRARTCWPAAALLGIAAVAASAPFAATTARSSPRLHASAIDEPWPDTFEGEPLRPARLLPMEERVAAGFPGVTAAFDDGARRIIMRRITQATRQVHPVSMCLRAGGFTVAPQPAFRHPESGLWSAFAARKEGRTYRVREHIVSARGEVTWTDVSSWFWSAIARPQQGPWLAVTVIELERPRLRPSPSPRDSGRSP